MRKINDLRLPQRVSPEADVTRGRPLRLQDNVNPLRDPLQSSWPQTWNGGAQFRGRSSKNRWKRFPLSLLVTCIWLVIALGNWGQIRVFSCIEAALASNKLAASYIFRGSGFISLARDFSG